MAILHYLNFRYRSLTNLKALLDYVIDLKKTSPHLIDSCWVSKECAFDQMKSIKQVHNKLEGRQYQHFVISYDRLKTTTPEIAFTASKKIAEYYSKDYQTLLGVHTNTKNLHAHVVFSTTRIYDGKRFDQSPKELAIFKEYANEVFESFGLPKLHEKVKDTEPRVRIIRTNIDENDVYYDEVHDNSGAYCNSLLPYYNPFPPNGYMQSMNSTICQPCNYVEIQHLFRGDMYYDSQGVRPINGVDCDNFGNITHYQDGHKVDDIKDSPKRYIIVEGQGLNIEKMQIVVPRDNGQLLIKPIVHVEDRFDTDCIIIKNQCDEIPLEISNLPERIRQYVGKMK